MRIFRESGMWPPSFSVIEKKIAIYAEPRPTTPLPHIWKLVLISLNGIYGLRTSLAFHCARGLVDRATVAASAISNELRQSSAERGDRRLQATHSQYNQMDQESQNNTDVRGISSEERLWKKTIEQQHCQQKEQEDEDEDNIEATSGKDEDKGPISYCQQIKESLPNQSVEDEWPLSHKTANTASNHIIRTMRIIRMTRTRTCGLQDGESGAAWIH
jgi:hypothetical protein